MELRIQVPNPDDYSRTKGEVKAWLSQIRVSLKAAEKTFEEATKNLPDEEACGVFIDLGIPQEFHETLKRTLEEKDGVSEFINTHLYLRVWD